MKLFKQVKGYEEVQLPVRSTTGASGYDFFLPYNVTLKAGEPQVIKTGIRFITDEKVWLACMPRSGLGFKYGFRLLNTIGNIDSDYWRSDNEGHIMAKVVADVDLDLPKGSKFMQGVILPYLTVDNDNDNDKQERNGGFGSTDKWIS